MHTSASAPYPPIDTLGMHDPAAPRALIFSPDAQTQAQVLTDLADYNHSLQSIAVKHQITLEALTLWMATPTAAAALNAIETAAALHNRLAASTLLPRAIPILMDALTGYQWEETHIPCDRSYASLNSKHKRRESARRSTSLLLRISRTTIPRATQRDTKRATEIGPALRHDLGADTPDVSDPIPAPTSDPRANKIRPALRPDRDADAPHIHGLPLFLTQLPTTPTDPSPSAQSADSPLLSPQLPPAASRTPDTPARRSPAAGNRTSRTSARGHPP